MVDRIWMESTNSAVLKGIGDGPTKVAYAIFVAEEVGKYDAGFVARQTPAPRLDGGHA